MDAPVKAPFTWPNSSDSRRDSGRAPQLTATNGSRARGLAWWMALAISSLPVPDSPWISTVASVGATRATRSRTRRISGERAMMPGRA